MRDNPKYSSRLADIRDNDHLRYIFAGADVVLHCAACKNVPVCEEMPTSCIRVNINGTENVISAALTAGVKKVVFTSSDKAVNPTNVMGSTKYIGERLIIAANEFKEKTSRRYLLALGLAMFWALLGQCSLFF